MAVLVLTNASITINSVDLSSHANSVQATYEVDAVEVTAFGGNHQFTGGLQNNAVEVTLMQDYASSSVEASIYGLVGTTTTLVIKPTTSAVGATNPSYTFTNAYLKSHTPVAGAVGELAKTVLSFTGGTLTKAVA